MSYNQSIRLNYGINSTFGSIVIDEVNEYPLDDYVKQITERKNKIIKGELFQSLT